MSDYVIKTFYFFYEKNIYENKKTKTSFVQEDGRNQQTCCIIRITSGDI